MLPGWTWQYKKRYFVVHNPTPNGKTTWSIKVPQKYNYYWALEFEGDYRNDG